MPKVLVADRAQGCETEGLLLTNASEQQRTTTPLAFVGVSCRYLAIAQIDSEPFPSAIRILPEAAVVPLLIVAEAALPRSNARPESLS
jgi:hypothetical protein